MRRTLMTCDRCKAEIDGPTRVRPGGAARLGMDMVPADDNLRDLCVGCATAVPWRGTYLVRWLGGGEKGMPDSPDGYREFNKAATRLGADAIGDIVAGRPDAARPVTDDELQRLRDHAVANPSHAGDAMLRLVAEVERLRHENALLETEVACLIYRPIRFDREGRMLPLSDAEATAVARRMAGASNKETATP